MDNIGIYAILIEKTTTSLTSFILVLGSFKWVQGVLYFEIFKNDSSSEMISNSVIFIFLAYFPPYSNSVSH